MADCATSVDGGEARRAFSAKVCGKLSAVGSVGAWGGFAARVEAAANGLVGVVLLLPAVANGFTFADVVDLTPNSVSPRLAAGCAGGAGVSSFLTAGDAFTAVCLVALNPLTLPALRLQAFRLHAHTYNLRSWPGKRSGRSPLSWSSKFMSPLQTLHLARAPSGAVFRSSHI